MSLEFTFEEANKIRQLTILLDVPSDARVRIFTYLQDAEREQRQRQLAKLPRAKQAPGIRPGWQQVPYGAGDSRHQVDDFSAVINPRVQAELVRLRKEYGPDVIISQEMVRAIEARMAMAIDDDSENG